MAYASREELASYLQVPFVYNHTADLALNSATELFTTEAGGTRFGTTSSTVTLAAYGERELFLPGPVAGVSAVRINGVAVTDYTRIGDVLYRSTRFGSRTAFPPDVVEVDLTSGYAAIPDDVKYAVLEIAAAIYKNPSRAVSVTETIDDFTEAVRYGNDESLRPGWRAVAAKYRAVVVA